MSMKTRLPTMNGTNHLNILSRSTYPFQTAIIHSIPKRITDAKPTKIKPIQKTIVFSPLNTHFPPIRICHTTDKSIMNSFSYSSCFSLIEGDEVVSLEVLNEAFFIVVWLVLLLASTKRHRLRWSRALHRIWRWATVQPRLPFLQTYASTLEKEG